MFDDLTPQQREVFHLFARGFSGKQVAILLNIPASGIDAIVREGRRLAGIPLSRQELARRVVEAEQPDFTAIQIGATPSASPHNAYRYIIDILDVPIRYFVDSLQVVLIFLTMLLGAYMCHLLVIFCKGSGVDPLAIVLFRTVESSLIAIDGFGIVATCGILTVKFLLRIARDDPRSSSKENGR